MRRNHYKITWQASEDTLCECSVGISQVPLQHGADQVLLGSFQVHLFLPKVKVWAPDKADIQLLGLGGLEVSLYILQQNNFDNFIGEHQREKDLLKDSVQITHEYKQKAMYPSKDGSRKFSKTGCGFGKIS